MPTFGTPAPIAVTLDIGVGDVRVTASERADTVVEVRPTDSARPADVAAAEQARVEYANGRLVVKAPKWRQFSIFSDGGALDVRIELPAGSSLEGAVGVAAVTCAGPLGECRLKAGVGDIQVDKAGEARLHTGAGDITVGQAAGHLEVATGSGAVRIGAAASTVVVRSSNGDCWIGEAGGDTRVRISAGRIRIDRAEAGVTAKSANGEIRVGEAMRGEVVMETAYGGVEVGIPDGTVARLDLHTKFGHVRNELGPSGPPEEDDAAVSVRGRTAFGDILIRRS